MRFLLLTIFFMTFARAEVGKILVLGKNSDAYVLRGKMKISLSKDTKIESNDLIITLKSPALVFMNPNIQVSVAPFSILEVKDSNKKDAPFLNLSKGMLRAKVFKGPLKNISLEVASSGVSLKTILGEFEVFLEEKRYVNVNVFTGEVEASSPHLHTFVPEIIKAQKGFRYNIAPPSFSEAPFKPLFLKYIQFENMPAEKH